MKTKVVAMATKIWMTHC